jgi:uncharacterized protein (TIGR02996 family)
MSEDPFLAAIRANPDDTLTRLVYADWLDERDDPRGMFLRLEIEAAATPEGVTMRDAQLARLAVLAVQLDVRWVATVCRVPVECGPMSEYPYRHPRRHPLNVPGPFYTCGNCMACEAPEAEAPHLLAPLRHDGNLITHFDRQPQSAAEVEAACRAIQVCCVDDLRYGGTDPRILTALGNSPAWCDYLIHEDSPTLVRADAMVPPPQPAPVLVPPVEEWGRCRMQVPRPPLDASYVIETIRDEAVRSRWRRWVCQLAIGLPVALVGGFACVLFLHLFIKSSVGRVMICGGGFIAVLILAVLASTRVFSRRAN